MTSIASIKLLRGIIDFGGVDHSELLGNLKRIEDSDFRWTDPVDQQIYETVRSHRRKYKVIPTREVLVEHFGADAVEQVERIRDASRAEAFSGPSFQFILDKLIEDQKQFEVLTTLKKAHEIVTKGAEVEGERVKGLDAAIRYLRPLVAPSTSEVEPVEVGDPGRRPLTDLGNAERLVDRYGQDLLYVPEWGKWLVWDNCRWVPDIDSVRVRELAADTVRSIKTEAEKFTGSKKKKLKAWAEQSEARARISAMVSMAEPKCCCSPQELDQNPWLLNCENGTLELRTGSLLAPQRRHKITKLAPVKFDPDADCPLWDRALEKVQPDTEMRDYLYRRWGYTMTGVIYEHFLGIDIGSGRNGKGLCNNAIKALLGDYAVQIPISLLMSKRPGSHPTDQTLLFGSRLALGGESEEGEHLDVSLVKTLTGGDPITARRMREDSWTFNPTHKLVLYTNHRPVIRETKNAIWDRVHLTPWDVVLPPEEQDKELPYKLQAEYSGILNRLVAGCLDWQRRGLAPPEAIVASTAAYRGDMDHLAEFLDDCCEVFPGAEVPMTLLYEHYERTAGKMALGKRRFGEILSEKGFEARKGSKGVRVRVGLRLRVPEADPVDEMSPEDLERMMSQNDNSEVATGGVANATQIATPPSYATHDPASKQLESDRVAQGGARSGFPNDAKSNSDISREVESSATLRHPALNQQKTSQIEGGATSSAAPSGGIGNATHLRDGFYRARLTSAYLDSTRENMLFNIQIFDSSWTALQSAQAILPVSDEASLAVFGLDDQDTYLTDHHFAAALEGGEPRWYQRAREGIQWAA